MPHIHEQYDYIVSIFIVYDEKVLLANHPRYDEWLPIGGHIELNEDPEQALYREVAEETGLEIELLNTRTTSPIPGVKMLPIPNYFDVHAANPPHKHISFTYFAKTTSGELSLSDEHTAMKWFTRGELEDPQYHLTPQVKFCAIAALEAVF